MKARNRALSFLVSLFLYWCVRRLLPGLLGEYPFLARFRWQYDLLLTGALLLAFIGALGNLVISRTVLLLRSLILFLISFTTGADPLIPALLLLAVIQEAGIRHSFSWTAGIIAANLLVALATVLPGRLVFGVSLPGMSATELFSFLAIVVPAICLALTLRLSASREKRWRETVDRLDLAVAKLAEANLGYQGYAQDVRGESIADERRRISREIHDTVGYSLTNIRVMLEAANLRMGGSPEESLELINQSIEEAGICLEQTRQAMRQLRGQEVAISSGTSAIHRLVNAFSEVTGIHVEAEYGNVTGDWPADVEKAVYRLVQEGMTNAFRHGMATEIMIYLWRDDGELRLIVRDNGSGSGEITEGLGITGMRERVQVLGGQVDVGPRPDGFEVRARLPLPDDGEEKNENADSHPVGG